ncbi:MAG: hypothetical protein ABL309_09090 [Phycisphaerales bacterium]
MFATDRDLWILEPRLFDDIAFSAQARLSNQPATVGAGSLALNFTGIDLTALGLMPGMVIALDGYGRFEITEVTSATALGVSRLRHAHDAPAIPLPIAPSTEVSATVMTFAPQIDLAHRSLLATLGIEPGDVPDGPPEGRVHASQILNPEALARAEALSALHTIYSSASALLPAHDIHAERAAMYARRAADQRSRTRAHIDLDHDGITDLTRSPSTTRLRRA